MHTFVYILLYTCIHKLGYIHNLDMHTCIHTLYIHTYSYISTWLKRLYPEFVRRETSLRNVIHFNILIVTNTIRKKHNAVSCFVLYKEVYSHASRCFLYSVASLKYARPLWTFRSTKYLVYEVQ